MEFNSLYPDMEERETLFSIADVIKLPTPKASKPELTRTQKREIILQEIYSYYITEKDKRKKENWKRYVKWCKDNRISHTPKSVAQFKRNDLYIKEMNFSSFKWCIKHLPLEDFYVVLSEVKDRRNRGFSVSGWLGSLFFKNV